MTNQNGSLRDLVQPPEHAPWIPPAPPLVLDVKIVLPDRATLVRVIAGLKRL
jgi:hypothetical protein